MSTIYRCVVKGCEDYKSLSIFEGVEPEVITIFPHGVDNAPSDLSSYQQRIDYVLSEAGPDDCIIFNGPAWLIALVGYAWYANEERRNHNVLVYSKENARYQRLTYGAIDDY